MISFDLAEAADEAVIEIFNIKGQKILDQKFANPISGKHQMVWQGIDKDGKATASGVYFYRLKVDNKTCGIQRMLLLK